MARKAAKRTKSVPRGTHRTRPRKTQTSVALARRDQFLAPPTQTDLERRVAADAQINIGQLGLTSVKLTEKEIAILNEPPQLEDIQIKPVRHPMPYLSHITYTRWFNRAFGRGGWALVPVGQPKLSAKSVVQPYLLHIHGKPVAFAYGEQEYHENNREQTYGDALEATVASALRRCGKRLGVGLEMWDRRFLARWLRANAVRVPVQVKDYKSQETKIEYRWRRKDDEALPFEQTGKGARADAKDVPSRQRDESRPPAPRAAHTGQEQERIATPQRQRLFQIAKQAGRTKLEVTAWIKKAFGYQSTEQITRAQYDDVIRRIEAPGPLDQPVVKEADAILDPEEETDISAEDIHWGLGGGSLFEEGKE